MSIVWLHRCRWLASLLMIGLIQRVAPWVRADDPAWFKLDGTPEASLGLEVDGSSETTHISGVNSVYDTLFITPTVGLRTSGSIYHPNLLSFDLDGELGWGWDNMSTTSPGYRQTINESAELNRYLVEINLLEAKPYNASFFAAEDHTYRDYGSFDTFTVDSSRYGGRINWNTDNLSINTDFGYRDEKDTGLSDSSEVAETYFNFIGINKRQSGQTTLTFRYDQFDNILIFASPLTSLTESAAVADSETFGRRKQITAATGVSYSHSEFGGQQTETLNGNEDITINHRPNLDSYLMLNFAYNYLHPESETVLQGVYGVRRQFYESLTLNLDAHGSYQDNSDLLSSGTTGIYGLELTENYTKRLRSWGRLTLGAGIIADHEVDNSSGSAAATAGEVHQLYLPTSPNYRPVYLTQPRVIDSTIQVAAAGVPLVEATDYQVITSGQLTEIQLVVPPSSHLQTLLQTNDNLTVSVTYQSDSLITDSFNSLNASVQVRLDLFGKFGIYGRMNWLDNDAPPTVLTQTLTDLVGGVDYNWRWLRAGAEYEGFDSNFSQYQAYRFYQDCDFRLNDRSSLSLNFNESFYHYPGSGDQTQYQFLTRYSVQLWSSVAWYVQGGCSLQDVLGSEELEGSAQTGLSWSRGKLSIRTGYEYNNQSTTSASWTETLEKNRLFAYLKRTF